MLPQAEKFFKKWFFGIMLFCFFWSYERRVVGRVDILLAHYAVLNLGREQEWELRKCKTFLDQQKGIYPPANPLIHQNPPANLSTCKPEFEIIPRNFSHYFIGLLYKLAGVENWIHPIWLVDEQLSLSFLN